MKKVVNINLGGRKFTIDDDAYQVMDTYLNSIKSHFSRLQGSEDILYDIEIRLSELFDEDNSAGEIITKSNVENVIKIMGTPSDFAGEDYEQTKQHNMDTHTSVNTKRLFRDPDNKVIAGVASGLASYMGINEPLYVRLGFIFFFLFFGIGFIPYILLWALVPNASTASDRLSMSGEKININTIARNIEDGFEDINSIKNQLMPHLLKLIIRLLLEGKVTEI